MGTSDFCFPPALLPAGVQDGSSPRTLLGTIAEAAAEAFQVEPARPTPPEPSQLFPQPNTLDLSCFLSTTPFRFENMESPANPGRFSVEEA